MLFRMPNEQCQIIEDNLETKSLVRWIKTKPESAIFVSIFSMNVVASVAQTETELNKRDKHSADLVVWQQCVRLSTEEVWIPDAKQRQDYWDLLIHTHACKQEHLHKCVAVFHQIWMLD